VPASLAAGSAIEQAILAEPYAELALAKAAVFLANTLGLRQIALQADVRFGGSSAGHRMLTLSPASQQKKVPEVTR
jgi:hypothetical protein